MSINAKATLAKDQAIYNSLKDQNICDLQQIRTPPFHAQQHLLSLAWM